MNQRVEFPLCCPRGVDLIDIPVFLNWLDTAFDVAGMITREGGKVVTDMRDGKLFFVVIGKPVKRKVAREKLPAIAE